MRKRLSMYSVAITVLLLLTGFFGSPTNNYAYEYTGGTKPSSDTITISSDPKGSWKEDKTFSNDSSIFTVNSPLNGQQYTVGDTITLSVTPQKYGYTVLPGGFTSNIDNNFVMTILKEDLVKKTFRVKYKKNDTEKTFTGSFTPTEEGTYKVNIFYRGSTYSGSNFGNYFIKVTKSGSSKKVSGQTYKILSDSAVAFTKAANKASVTVPNTVKISEKKYNVTQINKNAFKGSKIGTVTIGKNITKIKAYAFKGSKVKKIILKTKRLTNKTVKKSLSGSQVKTVKVKADKNTLKKYKKIFVKKIVGKKVTVK